MTINKTNFCDRAKTFGTHDMGVAAALIALGYEIISLDKTNPKKVLFVFQRLKNIEETASLYWSNKLKIKAQSFFDAIRALKNRLYSE